MQWEWEWGGEEWEREGVGGDLKRRRRSFCAAVRTRNSEAGASSVRISDLPHVRNRLTLPPYNTHAPPPHVRPNQVHIAYRLRQQPAHSWARQYSAPRQELAQTACRTDKSVGTGPRQAQEGARRTWDAAFSRCCHGKGRRPGVWRGGGSDVDAYLPHRRVYRPQVRRRLPQSYADSVPHPPRMVALYALDSIRRGPRV
eukprot:1514868-Rhodomonas_salina.1